LFDASDVEGAEVSPRQDKREDKKDGKKDDDVIVTGLNCELCKVESDKVHLSLVQSCHCFRHLQQVNFHLGVEHAVVASKPCGLSLARNVFCGSVSALLGKPGIA
jgi:hypothetical protein